GWLSPTGPYGDDTTPTAPPPSSLAARPSGEDAFQAFPHHWLTHGSQVEEDQATAWRPVATA
ncbi:hypothetical protein ABZ816_28440, partial [Actinosynnema sp. NPDC047251]